MNFIYYCKVSDIYWNLKFKQKTTLTRPTLTQQSLTGGPWPCQFPRWQLTGKNRDVATELISGEAVNHEGDVPGHQRLCGWAQSNMRSTGNLEVGSPPVIGHRRLRNDEAERRRLQSHDPGTLRTERGRSKLPLSVSGSPRSRWSRRRGRGRSRSPKLIVTIVGDNELDRVTVGCPSSIPCSGWATRGRW
jgi:hypothetical protein